MFRKAIVLSFVLIIAVTGTAFGWVGETCQENLDGTWNTKIWGGETLTGHCWGTCTLTVASDGSVAASGSYIDCHGASSFITGGQLSISEGCIIEGEIETDSRTIQVINGGIVDDSFVFGISQ